jgi:tripartite-type tricarboxylate transporter receptor subunit TctC
MDRRSFLGGVAGQLVFTSSASFSQTSWPSQRLTIVVPFAPGGQADLAARAVSQGLAQKLGQSVLVDNRPGAGGAFGALEVLRADHDGYTMLMALSAITLLPESERVSGREVSYEMSQFVPVARILGDPNLLVVSAATPYKTVQDFVAGAQAKPGEITYGSAGTYGASHLSMEMFATAAHIKLLHVPYRGGGPALEGILSGQVIASAQGAATVKSFTDQGSLRVSATFGEERHLAFPDAPSFVELGYRDVVLYVWAGLFLPVGVPDEVISRLGKALGSVMSDPATSAMLNKAGSPPAYLNAVEFSAYIAKDSRRLTEVVRKIGRVD